MILPSTITIQIIKIPIILLLLLSIIDINKECDDEEPTIYTTMTTIKLLKYLMTNILTVSLYVEQNFPYQETSGRKERYPQQCSVGPPSKKCTTQE